MAKGVNIAIAADASKAIKAAGNLADEFEKVSDSLDDLARDSKKTEDAISDIGDGAKDAGKDIERHLDNATKEAGEEADKLEKKFKDAFQDVKKQSRDAGDDVGKNSRKGFEEAGDATETFKEEAKQNLSETVSSFRGDSEDIAQIAQDILGGVVADLGPVGAAAGAAAAAGIGIAVSKLQELADKINESKERVGELAIEFKDAGGRLDEMNLVGLFDEWLVEIQDARSWFEVWQDDAITNLDNVRTAIEGTGISLGMLYDAFSENDTSALEGYIEKLKEVNREIAPDGHYAQTEALQKEYNTRKDAITGLEQEVRERKEAAEVADEMRAAEEGITVEVLKQRDAMEARNDALSESIDLNKQVIDGELDWLDTLDETTTKLAENAANGWDKNTAAGRENLRALGDIAEGALDYADSISEAGGSQQEANVVIGQGREALIRAAEQLGMTREQAETYANSLGLIPKEVSTTATAETTNAERDLQNVARDRGVKLTPWVDQSQWQSAANAAAQNVVSPYVEVKPYVRTRV